VKSYDIIIIGAGPAGCAAALSLKNTGLSVALCEKAIFPREKICGDGLCDRTLNTLKAISESYYDELFAELNPLAMQKAALYYKNKKHVLHFKHFGYTVSRMDFDQFLFTRIKRDCPNVEIIENCRITRVQRYEEAIEVFSKNISLQARFVIFANGAHTTIDDNFNRHQKSKDKSGFAIRAYYKGIQGLQENCIEMHYKKQYFPGYLWIFPMRNGLVNAGFGYHLKHAHQFDLPIKEIFAQWINTDLKHRFMEAEQVSPLKGGLIAYSTNKYQCYGNNYVVAGDSASLVDPISGGGIGNAMFSGREAALQALRCFNHNDFSSKITKDYASALKKRMMREMTKQYLLQRTFSNHRWLMDIVALFT